jgi:hypothetical protein
MSLPASGIAEAVPFPSESVRVPQVVVNKFGKGPPVYGVEIIKVIAGSELPEKSIPKSITGSDFVKPVMVTTYPVVAILPNVPPTVQPELELPSMPKLV